MSVCVSTYIYIYVSLSVCVCSPGGRSRQSLVKRLGASEIPLRNGVGRAAFGALQVTVLVGLHHHHPKP